MFEGYVLVVFFKSKGWSPTVLGSIGVLRRLPFTSEQYSSIVNEYTATLTAGPMPEASEFSLMGQWHETVKFVQNVQNLRNYLAHRKV